MLDALGGIGLATSAGLNAYLPLLAVAVGSRLSDDIVLPAGFEWLGTTWVLAVLIVLLLIEEVVDKVPGADHVNDIVQSVVRPASGAVLFAANTTDGRWDRDTWVALGVGGAVAFTTHGTKAAARAAANAGTMGLAAPVLSVIEDVLSLFGAIVALVVPALVVLLLAAVGWLAWRGRRWRRRRREARTTAVP